MSDPEAQLARALGAKATALPFVADHSTTRLLSKVRGNRPCAG